MKSRIIIAVLLICLTLSLAACNNKSNGGTVFPSKEAENTTKTEASRKETEAPKGETSAPEDNKSSTVRGVVTDEAYVNEALKIQIAIPDGWTASSDEQIALANNMTYEMFEDTDVKDIVKNAGQLMDMMMVAPVGSSMNLIIQPANPVLATYTDEQIFSASETTYRAQFKAAGMDMTTYETVTMRVGGQDCTLLHLVLNMSGIEANEYQLWLRDSDEFSGILTLTVMDGEDPQTILDGITILD